MRGTKDQYLRKGIGIVLAAVATFALALPAAAQSQDQNKNKDKETAVEKSKQKTKSYSDGVSGGIKGGVGIGISGGVGKSFGQGLGVDGSSIDSEELAALLAQAKSMTVAGESAANWADLASELKLESKLNFDNAAPMNLQYGSLFDSYGGTLLGLQEDGKDREKARERQQADRENSLYIQGSSYIDQGKWQAAVDRFDQVAEMKLKRADAGLFWKAWAQNKLGQRTEALATLSVMEKSYPQSRWLDDAKKLEVEVKQASGQPVSPDSQSDCELKLLALNGLQQADPAKAVPLLEKMIHSTDCVKIRSQAFFVLAQSSSPEARALMMKMARGEGVNPLVQERAIQALGMYRAESGREALGQIYSSSTDSDVKKTILRALMQSGDRARVLAAAKSEKDPELRVEAIRLLGQMGARDDVWQLYQGESSVDVKKTILQSLFQSGDMDHVSQLALNEKDHSLRMSAISYLGMMGSRSGAKNEETLLAIYAADTDSDVRKKVINALFIAGDAKGLVALARKENDPTLKKTIVSQLANMQSPDATAYLLELLNK